MTTRTYPQRNVAPWADFSTMPVGQLQTIHLRAGLELWLLQTDWSRLNLAQRTALVWWLLVHSAAAASINDRWSVPE